MVNIEYPVSGAHAMAKAFVSSSSTPSSSASPEEGPEKRKGKLIFVYCSGHASERDQSKKLRMFEESRKIKVCLFLLYYIIEGRPSH
jgi:hypothetical protein